jgi:hypothetical protein
MRGGRLGSLLAVGSLGLARALAGCGGDAFTTSDRDGEVTAAPDDAMAPPETGAPPADAAPAVDAGAGWCATQAATHTLCEDFFRGVPDKLVGLTVGAMLIPDTTDFESPPQSMAAVTPSLAKKGDTATALATHDFSGDTGTQFTLASYFKIAGSCFPGNGFDPVSIAIVDFPAESYAVVIDVTPSGVELVEATVGPDGGLNSNPQVTTFDSAGLLDNWKLWTLTIGGGIPKTVSLTVGAVTVIPSRALKNAPTVALLQHPTLLLGAIIKNDQGLSPGCKVNVDDVLFDVKALTTTAN